MWNTIRSNWQVVIIAAAIGIVALVEIAKALRPSEKKSLVTATTDSSWVTPSLFTDNELQGAERELVIYGEDIIVNTARYFGPHGSVAAITNGMNCQNCHLNAGKKTWGNNYSAVYST